MSYVESLLQAHADPRLPEDERRAADAQLYTALLKGRTAGDYIPGDEMRQWVGEVMAADKEFRKSVLLSSAWQKKATVRGNRHSILYVNELGVIGPGSPERYAEKWQAGAFDFLKYMAGQLDAFQACLLTRQRHVAAFARRYKKDDNCPLGYRWFRADDERMTKDDLAEVDRLDRMLQNGGTEFDTVARRWDYRRRSFQGFNEALIADSLTADACPIEIELDRRGKAAGWYNVPFSEFRLAHEDGYEGDDRIVGVQLAPNDRVPLIGFEKDEIVFEVRNPRSNLDYHDYGQAELEHFVKAATAYLNSFSHNAAQQDRNSMPRGFMTLYGRYNRDSITEFKANWNATVRGAAKRWAMPVLVAEDKNAGGAIWTPVDTANQEMALTKWMIFLLSLMTALLGMDPVEINMEAFTSKVSSLSGKDTAEKLQSSKDRGFIPLMMWLERLWNDHIISRFTSKYRIAFIGLYPADDERKHERQKLVLTVNEMRAQDDEEPLEDEVLGEAPINPALMGLYMQNKQMEQAERLGAMNTPGSEPAFGLPGSERPMLPQAPGAGARPGLPAPGQAPTAPRAPGGAGPSAARQPGGGNALVPNNPRAGGGFAKATTVPPAFTVEIREVQDDPSLWPVAS